MTRGEDHRMVEIKRPDRAHLKIDPASIEGRSRARQAAFRDRHPGLVIVATSADQVDAAWPA